MVTTSETLTEREFWTDIITGFFRPGRNLKEHVGTYWTDDAVLKTPMFTMKGKADVYHLLHAWQNVFDDHLRVTDLTMQGDKLMVRIVHNLSLRPLRIARHLLPEIIWKLIEFPLTITATLYLQNNPGGNGQRISRWYEDVSVDTLIYNLLPVNKIVNIHDSVEQGVGKVIAFADELGRTAYHWTAPYLHPVIDSSLRTVDGISKQYLGWDPKLYHSSRNVWS